jgi:dolichol-phosphate mannosyltransferase
LEYEAAERFSGESKYPLKKMLKFAKGSIVSFSTKPLVIGIWMGLITSLLSFIELIYILIQVIKGETVPGWASTLGIISLLFGVLFIILGIIGMYLARIHTALQNRPRFIIEKSSYSQNDQS